MPYAILTVCLLMIACCPTTMAEVGDVTLTTDHPQYPGEGAFQTPLDCVRWATREAESDQQRALAIFRWLLTHQWHLHSPQEWCQPGRSPGSDRNDYEMVVYDANRGRFSYGFGLCGTVHAWNEPYWQAAGFPARRRAFPGHTNSEVFVDQRWRMFDTDMAGIVLMPDGSVAGYDDITADLSLLDRDQGNLPRYPFAWPADFETMKAGWREVAAGGNWYKLYHGGYAAQPAVVHLRSGESLTRYPHPDAFGDPQKRRFWHQQDGGPSRLWTFANGGEPFHHQEQSNSRGQTRYGNAVFDYLPNLTQQTCWEGVTGQSTNLTITPHGLRAENNDAAFVVFEHFSPYVICGDPVDDQDPMRHEATDGFVIEGRTAGSVEIFVSPDQGQSWHDLGEHAGSFRLDATEQVKGHYGWWVKVEFVSNQRSSDRTVLEDIHFVTTGQICEAIYPRLKPNGTTVTYRARSRSVTPVLPRLDHEPSTLQRYEEPSMRSANLKFVGRGTDQRFAYRVVGPQPAHVVFRVPARTPLVGLSAAARFAVRSPTPDGAGVSSRLFHRSRHHMAAARCRHAAGR